MSDDCLRWRPLLGSHALDLLDDAERGALTAHLDGCPSCRAELDELARTANALGVADASRLDDAPRPPRPGPPVHQIIDAEVRRRRHRTLLVAAAVVAFAVVIAGSVVGIRDRDVDEQLVTLNVTSADVHATAAVMAKPWGTELRLDATGLVPGELHGVWLERADGSRVPAGTFVAVAGRTVHVVSSSGMARAEAVAVGISRLPDATDVARGAI